MPTPQGTRRFDRGANADRGEQPQEPRRRSAKLSGPQLLFLFGTPAILLAVTIIIQLNKTEEAPAEVKKTVTTIDPNVDINQFREHLNRGKQLCKEALTANLNEAADFKAKHKLAFDNCEKLQEELDALIENHKDKATRALPPELKGLNNFAVEIQQIRVDLNKIAPLSD